MSKDANTLVSFKDLMQAKIDREKRETESVPAANSESLVKSEVAEILPTDQPTNVPTNVRTYQPTSKTIEHPVSPERDFSKVPNSVRRAIEKGVFQNSSLYVYLYLLSLTRTAIKPKRIAKVPKSQLLTGSNLRAEKALLKNLAYLNSIGLIKTTVRNGDRGGNEYEVFTPDEISQLPTNLPTNEPTRLSISDTQVPTDLKQVGRLVDSPVNTELLDAPKTSFKDNTNNDDEAIAFSAFIGKLATVSKELTGKGISRRDREKWESLADLLILELRAAAKRTDGVSNVPAFLTEIMRRQFFAARSKPSKSKIDTVGRAETESYKIKPLDKQGREAALEQLREFKGDEFLKDFEKWYTPADWNWLMRELEK
jgi:hypothetical protein